MRWSTSTALPVRIPQLFVAAGVLLACAATASAQTPRVEGPFSGLFGGVSANRQILQQLDLRGSLFGVYQEVLEPSAEEVLALDPTFQQSGTFGGASGSASYQYQRVARRASFSARANGAAASYSVTPDSVALTFDGSTGLSAQLTKNISFGVSGSAGYAPFYNFGSLASAPGSLPNVPVGNDLVIPGNTFGLNALYEPNVNLGANASLNATVTRKSRLSLGSDYRTTWLTRSKTNGYDSTSVSGTYSYALTRQLSLRLGYHHEVSALDDATQTNFARNGYEFGLDYGDSLTLNLGRRTTLRVSPAASVVRWNNATHFRVNGSAVLSRMIVRSWSASAGYSRDLGFMIGFTQPILSDTANATLGGTLTRRVRLTNGISWTRGQIGFGSSDHMTSSTASSSVSVAITKKLALFTQYAYYVYDVPPGAWSLSSVSHFARQSVNAGLTIYVPVFSTGRTRR